MTTLSKKDFEIIEGIFHDGLGTYAEEMLANELIKLSSLQNPPFDSSRSMAKMRDAISRLPPTHPSCAIFEREIQNIARGAQQGAQELLDKAKPEILIKVEHVANLYANASAGDLILEFTSYKLPISVKTDKSGKVAVAGGQTSNIALWAERYFQVSETELEEFIKELGYASMTELKSYYLYVARLVALILMRKFDLTQCQPTDFSIAKVGNLEAVQYLFKQLLFFKKGNDASHIIILDRSTGELKWESCLDSVDIDKLSVDRLSFLPSRPRGDRPVGSEFGIKVDGKTIVTFQIKHKRGTARGTARQSEFSDITTRLRI
jgi:hypothetical protein